MRPEKIAILNEIREDVSASGFVFLTDYTGLTVAQMQDLRKKLAAVSARVRIVKNTMFKRVAEEMKYVVSSPAIIGPSAMIYGAGDVVQVAKVVKDYAKATSKAPVKMGLLGGQTLSAEDVMALAEMPSREVMLATVLSVIAAPMIQLAGVFKQKLSSIVYVLKAAQDKQEKQQ